MFQQDKSEPARVSRVNPNDPLSSWSKHPFELDGAEWPSVEHYYQAMKYGDADYRERIRAADHPKEAAKLGKSRRHGHRRDWERVKEVVMTRAVYTQCRTHPEVAEALLATGALSILETSQYDYDWGCGRDLRGRNRYGKVLMAVREKLREERG